MCNTFGSFNTKGMSNSSNECCPVFVPEKWDNKTHIWENKAFIKESIPTFFHIPFPPMIGKKATLMNKLTEDAKKSEANPADTLFLFRDPTPFRSELYLSVVGTVPNANNVVISGKFLSKVFDGGYNAVPKFIKQMNKHLATQGLIAKDYYVHYAYCPKCAQKFGANYMILFAQV